MSALNVQEKVLKKQSLAGVAAFLVHVCILELQGNYYGYDGSLKNNNYNFIIPSTFHIVGMQYLIYPLEILIQGIDCSGTIEGLKNI